MMLNQAIKFLSNLFRVEYPQYNQETQLSNEEYFLNALQRKIAALLDDKGPDYFKSIENIKEIQIALSSFTYSKLFSKTHGIDYDIELRNKQPYVTKNNYSIIFYCLVTLPKYGNEGLKNENHGHGYHIHYILIKRQKQIRTNILLTFNPKEKETSIHTLYWETHSSRNKITKHPDLFAKRRRLAIYDSSCGFLSKVKKKEFRPPSSKSKNLWPQ